MLAYPFLIIFVLPFLAALYAFIQRRSENVAVVFLLVVSLVVIGYISLQALVLVISISTVSWGMMYGLSTGRCDKFFLFFLTITLSPLIIYKYLLVSDNEQGLLLTIGIPIGLAFYSIHLATGLFESYKNRLRPLPLPRHLLATTFFPNFIAGPILSYKGAVLKFKSLPNQSWYHIAQGLTLLALGLLKVLAIAAPLGVINDTLYAAVAAGVDQASFSESIFLSWGVLVQLYFDFSGYSDIAIGIALCFGITLPMNFNSPFKAKNVSDYINRWHISLLNILKVYVFSTTAKWLSQRLPRRIDGRQRASLIYAISVFVVFLLAGLWHAPNITFVYSAIAVALFIMGMQFVSGKKPSQTEGMGRRVVGQITLLATASLIAAYFKAGSIGIGTHFLTGFVNFQSFFDLFALSQSLLFSSISLQTFMIDTGMTPVAAMLLLGVASLISLFMPNSMEITRYSELEPRKLKIMKMNRQRAAAVAFVFLWVIFYSQHYGKFFYEQF